MAKDTKLMITLPYEQELVPEVLGFIRLVAKRWGFEAEDLYSIELAVEEAVDNVLKHAFQEGTTDNYNITCSRVPLGLEIVIHDMGVPFDPDQVPRYNPADDLEHKAGSGLGSFLMRNVMDEVTYHNLGRQGKEVRLVKYHRTAMLSNESGFAAKQNGPENGDSGNVPVQIRLLKASDTIQVARCIYDAYGYSYPFEHVYYPERLAALNASKDIVSAVAVTPHGEVVGHIALIFSNDWPGLAEIGALVTSNRYRGQNIGQRLMDFVISKLPEYNLNGIIAHPVATHLFSQKMCRKIGMAPVAFLLGLVADFVAFRNIREVTGIRQSVVFAFKYVKKPEQPVRLYLPARYAGMIRRVYQAAGTEVQQVEGGQLPPQSVAYSSYNQVSKAAEVFFNEIGADAIEQFQQKMLRLRRAPLQVVTMFIRLNGPGVDELVRHAEEQGFLFTGVVPSSNCGDRLVMQYFFGTAIDYQTIEVMPGFTRELLDYIRKSDPAEQVR